MSKIILYHGTRIKLLRRNSAAEMKNTTTVRAFISPKVSSLQKNGQCADRMMQTAGYISMNLKPMD